MSPPQRAFAANPTPTRAPVHAGDPLSTNSILPRVRPDIDMQVIQSDKGENCEGTRAKKNRGWKVDDTKRQYDRRWGS